MQMVKWIFGGFFLLIPFLWFLAPKQEIYYLMEKELEKEGVVISNETFTDGWFGLTISDADIYFKGIPIAHASSLELDILFFYNQLRITSVVLDKSLHNIAPKQVNEVVATYSVIKPFKVAIEGSGSFGEIQGGVYLDKGMVQLTFPEVKDINALKKFLKKDATGWYYEKIY